MYSGGQQVPRYTSCWVTCRLGVEAWDPVSPRCPVWPVGSLAGGYRLAGLRAKEVMLMSFKIRMKCLLQRAEPASAQSPVGRGLLYRSLSVLFLHIRFLFAGGAADRPSEWAQAAGPGLAGPCGLCLDSPVQGECRDLLSVGRTWGCGNRRL